MSTNQSTKTGQTTNAPEKPKEPELFIYLEGGKPALFLSYLSIILVVAGIASYALLAACYLFKWIF